MEKPSTVSLKSQLASLENSSPLIGSWIALAHTGVAEVMARAGFDFLTLDLEHSGITLAQTEDLLRVSTLLGTPALVRLSGHDWLQAKRVMDLGATGVIVPMVNSAEDARAAVQAVHFPPLGIRGVGLARAQGYGVSFAEYHERAPRETVVIVQIEHIEAVRNMEKILAVEGVDGFIVGPYDLSASLGCAGKFEHPSVVEAMASIREVGKRSGKPGGVHLVEPDEKRLQALIQEGHRFIAYGVDFRMLDVAARQGAKFSRRHREHL